MKWIGESESGGEIVEMSREEFRLFVATQARREENIGAAVQKWRRENGVSQTALAKRAGISRNYVSQIETGEAANVSYRVHQKLMAEIRKGKVDEEREIKLVIDDFKIGGQAIGSEKYLEVGSGDFHSGSVFPGSIRLSEENMSDFESILAEGLQVIFWVAA